MPYCRSNHLPSSEHDRNGDRCQSDERDRSEHPLPHLLPGLAFERRDRMHREISHHIREEADGLDLAEVATEADTSARGERDEGRRVELPHEPLGFEFVRVGVVFRIVVDGGRVDEDNGLLLDQESLLVGEGK